MTNLMFVCKDLTRRRGEVDYTQDRSGEGEGLAVLKGSVPLAELRHTKY